MIGRILYMDLNFAGALHAVFAPSHLVWFCCDHGFLGIPNDFLISISGGSRNTDQCEG